MLKRALPTHDMEFPETGDTNRSCIDMDGGVPLDCIAQEFVEYVQHHRHFSSVIDKDSSVTLAELRIHDQCHSKYLRENLILVGSHSGLRINSCHAHKGAIIEAAWKYTGKVATVCKPSQISYDCTLTSLQFKFYGRAALPDSFYQWAATQTTLRKLSLFHCYSMQLTQGISKLTSLSDLVVMQTPVNNSLFWCTALESLTSLHVVQAGTLILPDTITRLQTLNELHMLNCHIAELPLALTALTSLTDVDFSYNNAITHLPWQICLHLTNLTRLDLSGNKLTTLPPEIGILLVRRTYLGIKDNQFRSLPAQMALQPPVLLKRNKFPLSDRHILIAFNVDGPLHTRWPSGTYLLALPRELQLVIHEYAAAPFRHPDTHSRSNNDTQMMPSE